MRKSKFQKTLSMLLAVLMIFMSMNFSVFAEEAGTQAGGQTAAVTGEASEPTADPDTPDAVTPTPTPAEEETGTTEDNTAPPNVAAPALRQAAPADVPADNSTYLTPGTPAVETINNTEFLFAKGTPITISAPTSKDKGAIITWEAANGVEAGSIEVSSTANVFGGGHNHEGTYESTSVTMTGGTVNAVFGGGLHKSRVETTNVVIKDKAEIGQINGGAASSFVKDNDTPVWPEAEQENAFVDTVNVTISGGKISNDGLIFGGGEGFSQTGNVHLNITGGTIEKAYITPGGSNGTTTGTATVNISTDIKDSIVQGVNRGTTNEAVINILSGAKVAELYAGGEIRDGNVTGIVNKTTVNIEPGSTVADLQPGKSGGTEIAPNSTGLITLNYDEAAVINEGENTLDKLEARFGAAVLGKTAKPIAVTDADGKLLGGYDDLPDAVDAAPENAIVTLKAGIYDQNRSAEAKSAGLVIQRKEGETGDVVIQKDKESAWDVGADNDGSVASLIDITADNVTLNNLIIQGAEKAGSANGHGINIVNSQNIQLNNITSKYNAAAGLIINSSEVIAHNLYTSENGWYGINLDQNKDAASNPQGSVYFELTYDEGINPEAAISDKVQIFADHGRNAAYSIDVNIPSQFKRYNSGSEGFLWSTREMDNGIYIEQDGKKVYYPTIQSAIAAAESGSTVYVGTGSFGTGTTNAPGTINIYKDITVEGQGNANSSILDKIEITADCTLNLNNITIAPDYTDRAAYDSIHMPASSNGATVNLNHSVIEQKVSGTSADSSSTASNGMRVDENATVEINLVDSQIKMNTGADAYNRGIQINGANSKVVLDQSTITNDTEGSAPYVWGVQANTATVVVKNESVIDVTGYGLRSGDNNPDFTVENSKIICRGNRDIIEGQNIFYGGVALDFQTGSNGKLTVKNSEITAGNIQDNTVRALSFLTSKDSVVTITDSKISSTGDGIVVQNGSDNIKIDLINTPVVAENGNGAHLEGYNAQVNLKSGSSITAKGSEAVGMYLSRNALVNVDKSSTVAAPNSVGVYFENFYSKVNPDDNNKNLYNEFFYGDAQEAAFTLNGSLYAKTAVSQDETCGSGKFGKYASGNKEKAGPIQINLGSMAKIYALEKGFEFNSAYEATGAAAIIADKNAKVYAPVLAIKGEGTVTDVSPLDALKFYAVNDVFNYNQESGAITLKEAAIENQTSGEKYLSIQEAIDNAYNNDRIYVPAGEYSENIKMTKPIKLIGAKEGISANNAARDGQEETILKGSVTFDNTKTIRSTLIDGFTFTDSAYIHAVYWSGTTSKPKISNVVIQNNIFKEIDTTASGKNNAAIHLNCGPGQEVDNVTIQDNQFKNITSKHPEGTEAAAYYTNSFSGNLTICNNVIDTTEGNAITISQDQRAKDVKVLITNNTIKNWTNRAIRVDQVKGSIDINQNSMIPGEKTITGRDTPQIIKITNSILANAAYNYWGDANPVFKTSGEEPSVIEGAINPYPYYGAADMTEESLKDAPATVYYTEGQEEKVRGMFGDIQEAVKAAETGDRIVIDEGVYSLTTSITIPKEKNLTIEGKTGTNGELLTTLQRDAAGDGNSIIISAANADIKTTVKNLNFVTTKDGTTPFYYSGKTAELTIEGCTFNAAHGVNYGGNLVMGAGVDNTGKLSFINNKVNLSFRNGINGAGNGSVITENAFEYTSDRIDDTSRTSVISLVADDNSDMITITDNIFKNANRAIAVDNSPNLKADKLTIKNNQFIDVRYGFELGSEKNKTCGTYDLSKNYYAQTDAEGTETVSAMLVEDADKSGSHFDDLSLYTGNQVKVYPYYIDREMTKIYAPVEVQHKGTATASEYFGTIADAYAAETTLEGDTIIVSQNADGTPVTITEDIDMGLKNVNLELVGDTTFNGSFAGSTRANLVVQNGSAITFTKAEKEAIQYYTTVDVKNFDATNPTTIVAPAASTSQNSFIAKGGLMAFSTDGTTNTWIYSSPSDRFNGGDGTAEKPWQINTPEQMKLLQTPAFETNGKFFKLTNDITVDNWTALASFAGNFDGNGYTITGNNVNFIDELAEGAKVEKLRFEGFSNLVNTNNGTVENCWTVGGQTTSIVNIMGKTGKLTDSFTAGAMAVQTNEARGAVLRVYHCGETGGIGTAMTKADMQKARFANSLNGEKEGVWGYSTADGDSAYPFVIKDGGKTTIQPITVTVTPDKTNADPAGYAELLTQGKIYANDEVKVQATLKDSEHYVFSSWTVNDVTADARTAVATIKVKDANTVIKANFTDKPKVMLNVTPVGAGAVYLSINDGAEQKLTTNTYVQEVYIGSKVTVRAEGYNIPNVFTTVFRYWIDANTGQNLSSDSSYTINSIGTPRVLQAVFEEKEQDSYKVQFNDINGKELTSGYYKTTDTINVPAAPIVFGYEFVQWKGDDGSVIDKDTKTITGIKADTAYRAIYRTVSVKYTIKVTDGTIDGKTSAEAEQRTNVTAVANKAPDGKVFVGWQEVVDGVPTGIYLSYSESYTFSVTRNMTIQAIYENSKPIETVRVMLDPTPIITKTSEAPEVYKASFLLELNVPEGYTVVETGFVYKTGEVQNIDELEINKENVIKKAAPFVPKAQFSMGVKNLEKPFVITARAYAILDNGTIMYSDNTAEAKLQ
ncbi:hypothetical protein SAMN04515624_10358 [Eubacterium maltosivorans]|uniref:InlB B-repeat-containing protein n=1 Tax=Eubacterium maltosivorans TaxID=2041044 RepID=UPI0008808938|nr:hypothetical protein [Eubacterium maltosivorans]WPK81311.1 hypothetical protein EUMA32_27410 [Eubacterium maltosivorans]SDO61418.1 hypothetical protein SAMN04515624_10358 [Eubacterium maltosivorans]